MSRRSVQQLRTILTGASSGIGRALALELAPAGGRLVLTARRADRLAEVQREVRQLGGQAVIVAGDITDGGLRQRALDAVQEHFGGLDCLINNAGVGALETVADTTSATLERIIEVNFLAVVEMTSLALPKLRQSPRAIVVNVGSILGHRSLPRYGAYCATKFALRGLSETLRAELAPVGVDVLLVSPGSTESEFLDNMLVRDASRAFRAPRVTPAATVARQTVRAMAAGRREIIPSWSGRSLVWLNRFLPGTVDRLLSR